MIYSVLTMIIFGLGMDSPTSQSPIDPKIRDLVKQLGDDQFRVRQKASVDLVQRGIVAIPAVRAGAKSTNLEVATRCEQLIPAIKKKHRETQVTIFLNDADQKIPTGLPGVRRFLAITGDTREARNVYAEMLREFHEIIESMEDAPDRTNGLIAKTVHSFHARKEMAENIPVRNGRDNKVPPFLRSPSEIALFFFVRTRHRTDESQDELFDVDEELLQTALVAGPKASTCLQKMFRHWFCNERRLQLLLLLSPTAVEAKMQEAIPNLIRCLKDENAQKWHKSMLLLDLYALGDKKNIADIETLINDTDVMQESTFSDELNVQHTTTTQLGDVALSICWLWSGKKLIDLNTAVKFQKDVPFTRESHYSLCAFESEADREAAKAQWKKLRAEMKKSK